MYHVYILRNKDSLLYIGVSTHLQERISQHNNNENISTRNKGPWRLIYSETYISRLDAYTREKNLKQFAKAYGQLKRRLKYTLAMLER